MCRHLIANTNKDYGKQANIFNDSTLQNFTNYVFS